MNFNNESTFAESTLHAWNKVKDFDTNVTSVEQHPTIKSNDYGFCAKTKRKFVFLNIFVSDTLTTIKPFCVKHLSELGINRQSDVAQVYGCNMGVDANEHRESYVVLGNLFV